MGYVLLPPDRRHRRHAAEKDSSARPVVEPLALRSAAARPPLRKSRPRHLLLWRNQPGVVPVATDQRADLAIGNDHLGRTAGESVGGVVEIDRKSLLIEVIPSANIGLELAILHGRLALRRKSGILMVSAVEADQFVGNLIGRLEERIEIEPLAGVQVVDQRPHLIERMRFAFLALMRERSADAQHVTVQQGDAVLLVPEGRVETLGAEEALRCFKPKI